MDNKCIRKITPQGVVSTFAVLDFGDPLHPHVSITIDHADIIYYSDADKSQIFTIKQNGIAQLYAGTGLTGIDNILDGPRLNASFFQCSSLHFDSKGNLFVADFSRIRKISPDGVVSNFAGGSEFGKIIDGIGSKAEFYNVGTVTTDVNDNLYIGDLQTIRKVTPNGTVSTFAGTVANEYGMRDGPVEQAQFKDIGSLAIDKYGNIYAADSFNHRIRKIFLQ